MTTALTAYDEIRRPFAQDIQARSSQNGKWLSLYEGSFESMERNVVDKWKWGMFVTFNISFFIRAVDLFSVH